MNYKKTNKGLSKQKALLWLMQTLELQIFLTLISLPVLIAWGLPISMVSLVSTPLFAPLFTIFLFFSCLMFFTELMCIPNSLIVTALEHTTAVLLKTIRYGCDSWLVSFCTPPTLVLCALPIIALCIIARYKQLWKRLTLLALSLIFFCAGLHLYQYAMRKTLHYIPCHGENLYALPIDGAITLIDPGLLGKKPVNESWIMYTLLPALAKETGAATIDCLVFLTLNQRILETLAILVQTMTIRHVVLPYYTGRLPQKTWYLLQLCKKIITQKGGTWTSIHSYKVPLSITREQKVFVCPTENQITYHEATYPALCVEYTNASGTTTRLQSRQQASKKKQPAPLAQETPLYQLS